MRSHFITEIRSVINQNLLYTFLVAASIVCFIYLQFYPIPQIYSAVRYMPAAYVLILLIFVRPNRLIGFSTIIIVAMYFIKICVVALVCAWGNFYSQISTGLVIPYWNEACLYIGIEWAIVAFSINVTCNYFSTKIHIILNTRANRNEKFGSNSVIKTFTYAGVAFCLFIALAFPNFGYKITFLAMGIEDYRPPAGQGGPFYLFRLVFEIIRPLCFFLIFTKIERSNRFRDITKLLLELLVILFCCLIMSEDRMVSLTSAIAMVIVLMVKRVDRHKFLVRSLQAVTVVLAVLLVMNMTLHNDALSYSWENISRLFNIYLGGYIITAAGFNVHLDHGVQMFFNDIINSTLLPSIVGHQYSTTEAINSVMNQAAVGTFFEMVVQARAMFGILFPVAIFLLIYFIEKIDFYRAIDSDVLHQLIFLYCGVTAAIFVIMYTYTMTFTFLLNKALILVVVAVLDKKYKIVFGRKKMFS